MSDVSVFCEKAEMFQRRAESATDPVAKRLYREMAAHYRRLLVEHPDRERHEPADRRSAGARGRLWLWTRATWRSLH